MSLPRQTVRHGALARTEHVDMNELGQKPRDGIRHRPAHKGPDTIWQLTHGACTNGNCADCSTDGRDCTGRRMPRLCLDTRTFIAQPVCEGLIDNVDAFQELAAGLQRRDGGGGSLFEIGRDAGKPDRIAVGLKPQSASTPSDLRISIRAWRRLPLACSAPRSDQSRASSQRRARRRSGVWQSMARIARAFAPRGVQSRPCASRTSKTPTRRTNMPFPKNRWRNVKC
jgi:hypothetical protein